MIASRFAANIHAMRVFNEQIGSAADEHDRDVIQQFIDRTRELLPVMEETEESLEIARNDEEVREDERAEDGDVAAEGPREEDAKDSVDAETMRSLRDAMSLMAKRAPGQGLLLRRGALTTLVSFFDVLVSDLIQFFYRTNPSCLPSDHTLTLAKLRSLGSIEDAEQHLTFKESDRVVREGLTYQLEYISGRLNVNLAPLDAERESLVEVRQRRNLLTHNNGIVNQQYLTGVAPELLDKYEAEEGKSLVVTKKYLTAAIDTLYVAGQTLVQLCWRKWDKGSTEDADTFIVTAILYELLREERFRLVIRMAERLKGARYATDRSKWMATVNHAIALRELERPNEMESVLSSIDWSTSPLEFRLSLCALRDEEEEFYQLLPRAVVAGEIERWELEDWPVFAHQRGTPRFAEAIEEHFPGGAFEDSDGGEDDE